MKEEIMRFIDGVVARATARFKAGEKIPSVSEATSIAISGEGMPARYQEFFNTDFMVGEDVGVTVTVYPHTNFKENAFVKVDKIQINIGVNPPTYSFNRGAVGSTVEHELIHVVQYLIEMAVSSKNIDKEHVWRNYGIPAEWISDSPRKSQTGYLSSGVEFFPWLQNMASRFLQQESRTKHDFLKFVKSEAFFKALEKKSPDMWKRAVKELWKIVSEQMDLSPESSEKAARRARSRPKKVSPDIARMLGKFLGKPS